jgi:hypothetical protein
MSNFFSNLSSPSVNEGCHSFLGDSNLGLDYKMYGSIRKKRGKEKKPC